MAYTNVYQMILLIIVSATLAIMGIYKVGGVGALVDAVPADYWNLFHPNDDPAFPWLPIILGYQMCIRDRGFGTTETFIGRKCFHYNR